MDKEATSHEWSESYSLGRRLLCENLSLILTNTFKDTSDELKDDSNLVNIPTIEEFLYTDISLHGLVRGENMELGHDSDTDDQIKNVVELAKALASMTGEPTKTLSPQNSDGMTEEMGESSGA
ncbi:hypothetical protein Tco_1056719 [Tanacetum coccineum]|uniref:Uncharacterized protein n=1 Tax=Tanacetum coccineum TaxID=301880 RepID=A0ABQ5H564_9ASTR